MKRDKIKRIKALEIILNIALWIYTIANIVGVILFAILGIWNIHHHETFLALRDIATAVFQIVLSSMGIMSIVLKEIQKNDE